MPPGERPSQTSLDVQAFLVGMRDDMRENFNRLHGAVEKLDDRLEQHARDDLSTAGELREEIGDVRDAHSETSRTVAKLVAHNERDAENRVWGGNGTGRYPIPSPLVPVEVKVDVGGDSSRGHKRDSNRPSLFSAALSGIAKGGVKKLAPYIGACIGAFAIGHFVTGPQTSPPRVVTVEVPVAAPTEPVPAPAPSPVPAATTTSSSLPEAGVAPVRPRTH